jgi:hypothetical protein
MKLRGLLLLLLLLAILLPLTTLFQSTNVPESGHAGIGNSVVVVARENYVYARVQIVVQPLENGTNVIISGGQTQPVTFTFPNGTSVIVTKPTTFTFILSNEVFFTLGSVSAGGPGYNVGPAQTLSVQVVDNQNATASSIIGGIPGIDILQYTVSGDYQLSVSALGVSL